MRGQGSKAAGRCSTAILMNRKDEPQTEAEEQEQAVFDEAGMAQGRALRAAVMCRRSWGVISSAGGAACRASSIAVAVEHAVSSPAKSRRSGAERKAPISRCLPWERR